MLAKKPLHRIFDYEPRFYKPEEDPDELRKRKLGFRSASKAKRKKKSPYIWLVFFGIVMYMYLKMQGVV